MVRNMWWVRVCNSHPAHVPSTRDVVYLAFDTYSETGWSCYYCRVSLPRESYAQAKQGGHFLEFHGGRRSVEFSTGSQRW